MFGGQGNWLGQLEALAAVSGPAWGWAPSPFYQSATAAGSATAAAAEAGAGGSSSMEAGGSKAKKGAGHASYAAAAAAASAALAGKGQMHVQAAAAEAVAIMLCAKPQAQSAGPRPQAPHLTAAGLLQTPAWVLADSAAAKDAAAVAAQKEQHEADVTQLDRAMGEGGAATARCLASASLLLAGSTTALGALGAVIDMRAREDVQHAALVALEAHFGLGTGAAEGAPQGCEPLTAHSYQDLSMCQASYAWRLLLAPQPEPAADSASTSGAVVTAAAGGSTAPAAAGAASAPEPASKAAEEPAAGSATAAAAAVPEPAGQAAGVSLGTADWEALAAPEAQAGASGSAPAAAAAGQETGAHPLPPRLSRLEVTVLLATELEHKALLATAEAAGAALRQQLWWAEQASAAPPDTKALTLRAQQAAAVLALLQQASRLVVAANRVRSAAESDKAFGQAGLEAALARRAPAARAAHALLAGSLEALRRCACGLLASTGLLPAPPPDLAEGLVNAPTFTGKVLSQGTVSGRDFDQELFFVGGHFGGTLCCSLGQGFTVGPPQCHSWGVVGLCCRLAESEEAGMEAADSLLSSNWPAAI